jgi:hypothetical protein
MRREARLLWAGEGVEAVLGDVFADLLPWCGGGGGIGFADVDLADHPVDDGGY